jgi:Resolvase, N terminal domain
VPKAATSAPSSIACSNATRRKFDVLMAWSVDRLGRSLQDLVSFLEEIRANGIDLYLHVQGLDTTTPGRPRPVSNARRVRRV